ncbi:plant UBX domain-containing protein 8-like [Impatiens glandulifera]|uniref:plant UBX domain-containing protein 8-like n=1 Tax=Impatiens glandulifera TaxID=253017 RepID=UPI001FB07439|nr:plant UBX domain-containing protein 8-like [Impatiens glandulifera]
MAGADREAVETFISITGASEEVAIRKLEDFHGDLNQAVNAYFTEGDRNNIRTAPTVIPEDDSMDIDEPFLTETRGNPFPFLSSARNTSPFALLDPDFGRGLFDGGTAFTSREPFVSHPREVREIPIEVIDGHGNSSRSGHAPSIEEITGSAQEHGPEIHGPIVIDEEDDEVIQRSLPAPSAPVIGDFPDYTNDIEEEMIRAAIEASKKDAGEVHLGPNFDFANDSGRQTQQRQPSAEDAQLAHAVSLSLKAVEQERAVHELGDISGEAQNKDEKEDIPELITSNRRRELIFTLPGKVGCLLEARLSKMKRKMQKSIHWLGTDLHAILGELKLVRHQVLNNILVLIPHKTGTDSILMSGEESRLRNMRKNCVKSSRKNSLQEIERNLAAKEAFLPKEPMADDENAVTLLVRMPDRSRRGRRFVKSDKLQSLFDFIDVGRVVKPDSYRLYIE